MEKLKSLVTSSVVALSITACGGGGGGGSDSGAIPVVENIPPVAVSSISDSALTGQLINISAAGSSDVDNDALTYEWSIDSAPNNSTSLIDNNSTADSTFTPDVAGVFTITFTVSDSVASTDINSNIPIVDPILTIIDSRGQYINHVTDFEVNKKYRLTY